MNKLRLKEKSLDEYPQLVRMKPGLASRCVLMCFALGLTDSASLYFVFDPLEAGTPWSWASLWPSPWAIHTGKAVGALRRPKGVGTVGGEGETLPPN